MAVQAVKMRSRGFICVNAHPEGCRRNVEQRIEGITSARPAGISGPKNALVIGASTGYGFASRIAAACGYGARTLGIFFEREPNGDRTATAGYYKKAVSALGVVVWPMVEFEADDALAAATARFKKNKNVEQIVVCSPDKDLSQLVEGERIVCWDRRRGIVIDENGVVEKFGVKPKSIPDWLGLVGDSADGCPGIPGWGAKSASSVLARFEHIESIPDDPQKWNLKSISLGRRASLAESLSQRRDEAYLYRKLATLRDDVPLKETLTDLKWRGAYPRLKKLCHELGGMGEEQQV